MRIGVDRFDYSVSLGERNFGELRRHSEEGRDPHPKECTGASPVDRNCHSRDIPDAHGCRERGGERLKMGDVSWFVRIVVSSGGHGKAVAQAAKLDESESQGEKDAGADESDDHKRDALITESDAGFPDETIQSFDEMTDSFHGRRHILDRGRDIMGPRYHCGKGYR